MKEYLLKVRGRDSDGSPYTAEIKVTRTYRDQGYIYGCYGRETVFCADIASIDMIAREEIPDDGKE